MAPQGKHREENFTKEEKSTLIKEAVSRRDILDGSISPNLTPQRKERAWQAIADKVAMINGNIRSTDKLRKKFSTMKSELKSKLARRKREAAKTGGGPPPPPLDADEEDLRIFLAEEVICGIIDGVETPTYLVSTEDAALETLAGLASGVCPSIDAQVMPTSSASSTGFAYLSQPAPAVFTLTTPPPAKRQRSSPPEAKMPSATDFHELWAKWREIEEERLSIEKRRWQLEVERLSYERARLEVEKERLELEKQRAARHGVTSGVTNMN